MKLSLTEFKRTAASVARDDDYELATAHATLAAHQGEAESEPSAFMVSFVAHLLTGSFQTSTRPDQVFDCYKQLLWILTNSKKANASERRRQAIEHIDANLDLITRWHSMVDSNDPEYQLDAPFAWWYPGDAMGTTPGVWLSELESLIDTHSGLREEELHARLQDAGYRRLDQETYRERIRTDVLLELIGLRDTERIRHAAAMIALFTTARLRLKTSMFDTICEDERTVSGVVAELIDRLRRASFVALPRSPLATIPKEASNLAYLSTQQADNVPEGSGIKIHPDRRVGGVLVYDQLLVRKKSGLPDSYIRIPLAPERDGDQQGGDDAFSHLLHSLVGLSQLGPGARLTHMQDIPRVIAGMFRAATQDESLGWSRVGPGHYLDTEAARRLTALVGFDPDQNRHTQRVRAVRQWLETIELHRVLPIWDERKKKYQELEWAAPIVQMLKDRIQLKDRLPEGLKRSSSNLRLWRLSPELWEMRDPTSRQAQFMLLDQRAFLLDSGLRQSTSEPFNLYWTIIQRAYQAAYAKSSEDKVDDAGCFAPRAQLLYYWSGIQHPSDTHNPHRVRQRFREHLNLMIDHGLLTNWVAPELESDELMFSLDDFLQETRLRLYFPLSQLRFLPHEAFQSGTNPFSPAPLLPTGATE